MQAKVTIIKNNHLGQEVWHYQGKLLTRSAKGMLFEACFNHSDIDFNGIHLKEGDRFLELYPFNRYFNIYEIYDRDSGLLKGWYCNVTRPVRVKEEEISYDDLALDLLVYPDGRQLVLDEDEFAALPLNTRERQAARDGLMELQELFRKNQPFDVQRMI
jgi:predicted RNA-binding protein associated with RNAse of E/G family